MFGIKHNARIFPRTAAMALLVMLLSVFLGTDLTGTAVTFAQSPSTEAGVLANETVLIHLTPGLSAAEREQVLAELNCELVQWLAQINVAEVRLLAPEATASAASQLQPTVATVQARWWALERHAKAIVAIEPNAVVNGTTVPNDPDLADSQRSYGLTLTHAQGAWEYTRGISETIIAVVDTGLLLNHPEFVGRIAPGYDFINNDDDPSDDNGHGTHTAGIIAAGIDNGIGMAGVCPECRIMPVKVLNQNNAGTWAGVANGLLYATDHGARVVNLSLGAVVSSKTLEDAISYAQSKGVLIVAAAGNMGIERKFYPAAIDGVLAVSATDSQDRRWNLSNYGDYIDVAAPGYAIYSTYHDLTNYYGGYTYMSGTSMAAPYVTGLAGLLISQHPERTVEEVVSAITNSADKLSDQAYDLYTGYGRINMQRALALAADTQWSIVDGDAPGAQTLDPDGAESGAGDAPTTATLTGRFFLPLVFK